MPALALTDQNSLTGAVEFYQACQEVGVQPILGLEVEVGLPSNISPALASSRAEPAGPARLVLLAMELEGWSSLCRLCSAVHTQPQPGALSFERLALDHQGLLCLTGGRRGILAKLVASRQGSVARNYLEQLGEVFNGRLYVELQRHTPEDTNTTLQLAALAHRLKLPVVASHSVHYLLPEEAPLQRLVTAVRLNQPLKSVQDRDCALPGSEFLTGEEIGRRFSELPAALEATLEIAGRCRLELPLGVPHYPALDLPTGTTARQALRQAAELGARALYTNSVQAGGEFPGEQEELPEEVRARLEYELDVITECGYEALFLMMAEIVQFTRQQGIPISSRGSAASSLVAHCLGITSPDPIRLDLFFERFLNPARATPPDIDTDLCSRRRDEVIRHVYHRYGEERVAMVGTINRFRRRSALRETAKAHGLPASEIKKMVDSLTHYRPHHQPQAVRAAPFGELAEVYPSPVYQQIFAQAAALIGKPRHLSVHAGGVVIAPGSLTDLAPTQPAPKGVIITGFDLDSIEALGLVKIDLLGIRGLTVLGDVAEAIRRTGAGEPDSDTHPVEREGSAAGERRRPEAAALALLEAIPEEDLTTSALLREARTIGCFQIESPGMRATLKEIGAHSIDDLMVALALYRPGPLTGGLKDDFVRRHRGEEQPSQLHPALSSLLADTYGVILYQEQVLRIAHELAGLSLADADLLRRAMSHFDPGERMRTLQLKFIAGAGSRAGLPAAVAERVWELMAAFAGYGFPKAHAASYAQVAWRGAWCKAHYPAVFMAAVLANWGGYYPQRVYLTEARRLGQTLRPPQVNYAGREFGVRYLDGQPVLFMGLDQVRDLTRRTQARILKERPFTSLADFLARADPRPVEADHLARSGALAEFGSIPEVLREIKGGWQRGQLQLFSLDSNWEEDWSLADRVAAQEEILGVGVDAHPMELHAGEIAAIGALTTVEAAARAGQPVRVAGMRQTWSRLATLRGGYFYNMSLEDLEGILEVFIEQEVYRRHRKVLEGRGPFIVEGTVELNPDSGEPFVRAGRLYRLEGLQTG